MADFKTALKETLGIEGGISNNPKDRGGFTYKGISRKNWPMWEGWHLVDHWQAAGLTPLNLQTLDGLVERFYRVNFWDRISLSAINSQKIANELFDTGVNAHTKTAVTFLQKALNLLNQEGKLYSDILVDGILGSKTLELTNNHPYPDSLLKLLNGLQLSYYIAICEKDPTQEVFLRGWLKRTI
jgi:lysozyme family protein